MISTIHRRWWQRTAFAAPLLLLATSNAHAECAAGSVPSNALRLQFATICWRGMDGIRNRNGTRSANGTRNTNDIIGTLTRDARFRSQFLTHSLPPLPSVAADESMAENARVPGIAGTSVKRTDSMSAPIDVQWRKVPGPAWVRNVPQWVTDNARYYHRRGLPLVQLWQSPRYQVALGLSNHGVPGVYFSQKLP